MSMKNYAVRAFQSSDQRFARVFEKLGYSKRDMQAESFADAVEADELEKLRAEYESRFDRKPRQSWDAGKILAKIDEKNREDFGASEISDLDADQ